MAAKKSSGTAGGALVFLGSLVYLYVVFTWYSGGGALPPWVALAGLLGPFVIAGAIVSAITLFFLGIGALAGKMEGDMMMNVLWRFIMIAAVTSLILTGGGSWFYVALLGFVLTYLGAMMAYM